MDDRVLSDAAPEITVTFQDILDGRAYLRIPPAGKILLAHWAGAPWSDKDPDAFLHALQGECLFRRERERIIHGASRLGKSVLGGSDLIAATVLPGRKVAVVADRFDHVAHEFQYLHRGIRKLFRDTPQAFVRCIFRNQLQYHDFDVDTIWGARAIGISVQSDEGAQLMGRELTDVVIGEGSHVSKYIFDTKLLRALDGAAMKRAGGGSAQIGSLSIYTTPRGYEGCSAAEWERVKKTTKGQPEKLHYGAAPWPSTVWVREASILENPAYDRSVFDARKASLDKRAFEEQYLGKMTFASGRVYPSFDEDGHVVPLPPAEHIRTMKFALGIDTGAHTAMLLIGLDRDGRAWVLGEVYAEKPPGGIRTVMEWTEEMLVEVLGPVLQTGDAHAILEAIEVVGIDPASQHKLEIVDRWDVGLTTPGTNDKRSLLLTIDRVERLFADDLLRLTEDCTVTLDQARRYVWKQQKAAGRSDAPVIREPVKVDDHTMDALRFGLLPLIDSGIPTEPQSTQTFAEAWESAQRERIFGPLRTALEDGARQDEWRRRL